MLPLKPPLSVLRAFGLVFCDFLLLVQKKVTKEKDSLGFSTTH
jgi:hypothetical protein